MERKQTAGTLGLLGLDQALMFRPSGTLPHGIWGPCLTPLSPVDTVEAPAPQILPLSQAVTHTPCFLKVLESIPLPPNSEGSKACGQLGHPSWNDLRSSPHFPGPAVMKSRMNHQWDFNIRKGRKMSRSLRHWPLRDYILRQPCHCQGPGWPLALHGAERLPWRGCVSLGPSGIGNRAVGQ